ncbi:hypothetical protein FA95DRAFT_1024914 [Auriscalpium vulgare]|uniref:Uncharacterized protein n=1 Tax=Auriscalpium vulgare TaxID=40419 RepID=A0ACB8RXS5_9AGAM|nr:hypothetical protein FA95DRAFT_1024914 [Auriscalpium vulgare]
MPPDVRLCHLRHGTAPGPPRPAPRPNPAAGPPKYVPAYRAAHVKSTRCTQRVASAHNVDISFSQPISLPPALQYRRERRRGRLCAVVAEASSRHPHARFSAGRRGRAVNTMRRASNQTAPACLSSQRAPSAALDSIIAHRSTAAAALPFQASIALDVVCPNAASDRAARFHSGRRAGRDGFCCCLPAEPLPYLCDGHPAIHRPDSRINFLHSSSHAPFPPCLLDR